MVSNETGGTSELKVHLDVDAIDIGQQIPASGSLTEDNGGLSMSNSQE